MEKGFFLYFREGKVYVSFEEGFQYATCWNRHGELSKPEYWNTSLALTVYNLDETQDNELKKQLATVVPLLVNSQSYRRYKEKYPSLTLEIVKSRTYWRSVSQKGNDRPAFQLVCPLVVDNTIIYNMHEILGEVRANHDGRWRWYTKTVQFNEFWNVKTVKEGVEPTKELAFGRVSQGWITS